MRAAARLLATALLLAANGVVVSAHASEGPELRLDDAARSRLGITVAAAREVDLPRLAQGFGRLLDPVALATAWYDVAAARAAFEAAQLDYRRVQTLQRGDTNASRRDLEAAQATLERARTLSDTAEAHFVAAWGRIGDDQTKIAALAARLARREAGVARINLPLDSALPAAPATARVRALADPTGAPVGAVLMGEAPDTDPTLQARGFFLLMERPPWPSGTSLEAWLAVAGPSQRGVDVPAAALVRHAGEACVYVQTATGGFARRTVHLEVPTDTGWLVTSGLSGTDRIVVTGAQLLLSLDLGGAAEEP